MAGTAKTRILRAHSVAKSCHGRSRQLLKYAAGHIRLGLAAFAFELAPQFMEQLPQPTKSKAVNKPQHLL